jgi:uncharacterized RDD family membrane protein YckC
MANVPPPPTWPDRQQVVIGEIGPPGGFWIRFVAYWIDGLIVTIAAAVLVGVFTATVALKDVPLDGEDTAFLIGWVIVLVLALIVINWLYEALMTSSPRGATLGKLALGLLSFGRASARHFLKVLITPLVPFAIGYLMAAFTARKRALHDVLADTLVIRLH